MNKTVKASIAATEFTLEEDAYILLKDYLGSLSKHFASTENAKEIIDGIEERIADLFIEKSVSGSVINTEIVNEVIAIIGKVEDIDDGEVKEEGEKESVTPKRKKLYRDVDNKVIAGVCSGLGHYLNIDSVWIRLIFIIGLVGMACLPFVDSASGVWFLAYIVLWIAMPAARTTEQKYEMRGEGLTAADVARGAQNNNLHSKNSGSETATRIISGIIGVCLLLIGLGGVLAVIAAIVGVSFVGLLSEPFLTDLIDKTSVTALIIFKFCLAFFFLAPFVGMIYGGVMLIGNFKNPNWHPGLILFCCWIVSLLMMIASAAKVFPLKWWQENSREKVEQKMEDMAQRLSDRFDDISDRIEGMNEEMNEE